MPTFSYTGPTPATRQKWSVDAHGNPLELAPTPVSDPIDYEWDGGQVAGRTFEVGEHFSAVTNPDPALFTEV